MEGYHFERFVRAQQDSYPAALAEVASGRKRTHWMWYIFPQIRGLGMSETSRYYSINDLAEAQAYLDHPVLGARLLEISQTLLTLKSNDAHQVFGSPDDLKLRSSMTLFAQLPDSPEVFQQVLDKFFGGQKDARTLQILGALK
ncbi:MAG: DUF1810 domain-containing protein [Bacteroidota bacterium]|nr:DUF1810 domain-containing protein [Bacteroidota bacterium]